MPNIVVTHSIKFVVIPNIHKYNDNWNCRYMYIG